MSEEAMSGTAKTLPPKLSRWLWIAAALLALLGSAAAPARAGDFDAPYGYGDGYGPSRYDYGPSRYEYHPYGYYHRCWRCGCGGCRSRSGLVYERKYRYVEREYVERRYASPVRRYPRYGWHSYGWHRSYPSYRNWSTPFPWGYGGIRDQRPSYGYGRSAYYDAPPRPPAPVGYDADPDGDEGRRWDPD
jgi:hypothetical protein